MNKKYSYDYFVIYMTINLVNKKRYIGWHATNNLYDGYTGSGKLLKRAIKKYGQDNFITGIIEFCDESNVLDKEIYWITYSNTMHPNGYNLTLGGEGSLGRIYSSETIQKMRNAQIGKIASNETKEKMKLTHTGKIYLNYKSHPISEETKLKLSIKSTGRKHSDETKTLISIKNSGKKLSEERKIQISLQQKNSTHNLKLVTCPYCGTSGKGGNMTRYHFNKCKNNC